MRISNQHLKGDEGNQYTLSYEKIEGDEVEKVTVTGISYYPEAADIARDLIQHQKLQEAYDEAAAVTFGMYQNDDVKIVPVPREQYRQLTSAHRSMEQILQRYNEVGSTLPDSLSDILERYQSYE